MLSWRKSPLHGYGMFANEFISKGTIILKSPYLDVTGCTGRIQDYYFSIMGKKVLPLDRAAIINHSFDPNTMWKVVDDLIVFTTLRDIQPDEELTHCYNENSNI